MNRTALARQALEAADHMRRTAGVSAWDPVCPFDIAAAPGVGVRVQLMAMRAEGLYSPNRGNPSAFVNAERPGARQRFTCAHELGHHAFGHGICADDVVGRRPFDDPAEFMADVFAGYLLMPEVSVLRAFRELGAAPASPDVFTVYVVASEFGVGYGTLLTHLVYTTGTLSRERADDLARWKPKRFRKRLVPGHPASEMTIVSPKGRKSTYDVVAGSLVLALGGANLTSPGLDMEGQTIHGPVIRALYPGIWPLRVEDRQVSVRVMAPGYEGRAANRHRENDEWTLSKVEQ